MSHAWIFWVQPLQRVPWLGSVLLHAHRFSPTRVNLAPCRLSFLILASCQTFQCRNMDDSWIKDCMRSGRWMSHRVVGVLCNSKWWHRLTCLIPLQRLDRKGYRPTASSWLMPIVMKVQKPDVPEADFVVLALQSDMDSGHGQCTRTGTFGRRLCGCNNLKLHHHGTAEVHTKISVWALQWFVALARILQPNSFFDFGLCFFSCVKLRPPAGN